MLNALRYEIVRLRSLRSTWVLLGCALALQFVVALEYAGHTDMTARERFVYPFTGLTLLLVSLFTTAVGVASFGHEYRYRTIATTMLTLPSRSRILAAKVLTVAAVAAAAGVGLVAVTLLAGALRGGIPSELWRVGQVLAAVVVYLMLSALVGLGIAALTRNATLAMIAVLGFPAIVETALLLGTEINERLLPFTSALKMVSPQAGNVWTMPLPLLVLMIALVGTGGVLLSRRDA